MPTNCRPPGQLRDEEAVRQALIPLVASANEAGRHFLDSPLVDEANDETHVVYKVWGTNTEQVLADLVRTSPEAGVTFRAAGN